MKQKTGLLLAALLCWLLLFPIALVLLESFRSEGAFSLANYAAFAGEALEWRALWNSLWISAATVVMAGVIGVPLAFIFERFDFST